MRLSTYFPYNSCINTLFSIHYTAIPHHCDILAPDFPICENIYRYLTDFSVVFSIGPTSHLPPVYLMYPPVRPIYLLYFPIYYLYMVYFRYTVRRLTLFLYHIWIFTLFPLYYPVLCANIPYFLYYLPTSPCLAYPICLSSLFPYIICAASVLILYCPASYPIFHIPPA